MRTQRLLCETAVRASICWKAPTGPVCDNRQNKQNVEAAASHAPTVSPPGAPEQLNVATAVTARPPTIGQQQKSETAALPPPALPTAASSAARSAAVGATTAAGAPAAGPEQLNTMAWGLTGCCSPPAVAADAHWLPAGERRRCQSRLPAVLTVHRRLMDGGPGGSSSCERSPRPNQTMEQPMPKFADLSLTRQLPGPHERGAGGRTNQLRANA